VKDGDAQRANDMRGTSRAIGDAMATRSFLRTLFAHHATLALLLGLGGAFAIGSGACGGTGEGNAGAGASSGNGNGNGTGEGGGTFTGGTMTGTMSGTGGGCAGTTQEAELTPVTMFIMFDRSGSMASNNKWGDSVDALTTFVADPGTAGLGIALRYFPDDPGGTCLDPVCSFDGCSQPVVDAAPVTVDSAPTDSQEAALVASLTGEAPNGDHTPIYPSLGGAIQWAAAYQSTHPGEKAVVVYVTDGEPNGCDENENNIAALAGNGWTNDAVYTYAVGLEGSNVGLMHQIAAAGNTGQAIIISAGGTAAADLLAALQAIQGNTLACNFAMPTSQTGEEIDPTKVNVTYTPGSGGMPVTINQVSDASACTAAGGWHYDNPAAPTQIILCPTTCQTVQADPTGKIQIVVGCGTQTAE
jgi:hypothetical protein